MLKNSKGITLVALIITIIIMLILVGVSIQFGTKAIDKARLEDIKTNMLSIKTKAKTIEEKYSFGDIDSLVGIELVDKTVLNSNLQSELQDKTVYKWDQETLNAQGLTEIKADNSKFYIVYYDMDAEKPTCEVYYSVGYQIDGQTKYSLTDLER